MQKKWTCVRHIEVMSDLFLLTRESSECKE
jgi:hypothetical protein